MSIPGIQVGTAPNLIPYSNLTIPSAGASYTQPGVSLFDQFKRTHTDTLPSVSSSEKLKLNIFHPILSYHVRKTPAPASTGESPAQQLKMYTAVHAALNAKSKRQLRTLMREGVLSAADTDNKHSTLYQLYNMLTTPRSPGYDAKTVLQETVEILHQPYAITQKFEPLSENAAREILQLYNNNPKPVSFVGPLPAKSIGWADLSPTSATCVSSSVMYYMADKKPGELARHLNELTSPGNAFYEKVKLSELSPDNPAQAYDILKQHNISYYPSGPDEVTVKVENPTAGIIRAKDSQNVPTGGKYRNAIQAAYQSTLTYLATRSYDAATDLRDSDIPGEGSKGLTENEKTLMESIVKDNGGVQSVTYQVINGKANPAPGEEGSAYLYGYTRPFEQTINDIISSLRIGEPVIIGITDTDATGDIGGTGHEITITGATTDAKTGELKFIVADSDDDVPALVVRSASELIPRIHHAGLPLEIARKANAEIQGLPGFLVPDDGDASRFQLMARQTGPFPGQESAPQPEALTNPIALTQVTQPQPLQQTLTA